jgi:hypothetical protein
MLSVVRCNVEIFLTTDEDFERYALQILQRELGIDGLARFLRLNRAGDGGYIAIVVVGLKERRLTILWRRLRSGAMRLRRRPGC